MSEEEVYGDRADVQAITFHLPGCLQLGLTLTRFSQENVVQQVRNLAACDIIKTVSTPASGPFRSR
jgi:hypothetical protein